MKNEANFNKLEFFSLNFKMFAVSIMLFSTNTKLFHMLFLMKMNLFPIIIKFFFPKYKSFAMKMKLFSLNIYKFMAFSVHRMLKNTPPTYITFTAVFLSLSFLLLFSCPRGLCLKKTCQSDSFSTSLSTNFLTINYNHYYKIIILNGGLIIAVV